jgi:hypothetical protein
MHLIPVVLLLAGLSLGPARGQDEPESLRDRLIRRVDARLEVEMRRVRAALVEEIDAVLAEEGEAPAMPDGYARLLDQADALRERLTARKAPPAPAPAAARTLYGAAVSPAPAVLVRQLGVSGDALLVDRVPEGSRAERLGLARGDLVLDRQEDRFVVLRKGERMTIRTGGEEK